MLARRPAARGDVSCHQDPAAERSALPQLGAVASDGTQDEVDRAAGYAGRPSRGRGEGAKPARLTARARATAFTPPAAGTETVRSIRPPGLDFARAVIRGPPL